MAKTLKLISLRLRNFKGIQQFALDTAGGNVSVYGDNATGKTTLADAFMWLLFDKDSANQKQFEIKTLDLSGQPVHNLEHEVEGVLEADGRRTELRKVYKEVWTKKRGSATPEFTGHTSDYFIDGVPVQLKEFKDRVAAIADENTFRLLTDPRYFNEVLKWEQRRQILLEVCGDVADAEVIASDRALAQLPEVLGNRSLEDHKKVLTARRKTINDELKNLPVRIDEANRALPEVTNPDRKAIQADIDSLNERRLAKQGELARIDNGAQIVELKRQIGELEIDILNVGQRLREASDKAVNQERAKLAEVSDKADTLRRENRRLQLESQEAEREAAANEARREKLKEVWRAIKAREFTLTTDEVCAACGQALPADQVDEARQRAQEEFNAKLSADLEANVTEGRGLKARYDVLTEEQERRTAAIEKAQAELTRVEAEVVRLQERISQLRSEAPDPTQDAGYQRLAKAKAELEAQIAGLREGSAEARLKVNAEITAIDSQVHTLRGDLARIDQREAGLKRIEELKAQEQNLAAEYERLEREHYLCEQFTKRQAEMLEERVNKHFQYVTFKLFNKQVNGGIDPTCETLVGGVPYGTSLNTGARLNAGLDIINTLSEHYGFTAPIWVDNAEAVTKLFPTRAQMVRLVVSEADKQLRVEREAVPALQREAS